MGIQENEDIWEGYIPIISLADVSDDESEESSELFSLSLVSSLDDDLTPRLSTATAGDSSSLSEDSELSSNDWIGLGFEGMDFLCGAADFVGANDGVGFCNESSSSSLLSSDSDEVDELFFCTVDLTYFGCSSSDESSEESSPELDLSGLAYRQTVSNLDLIEGSERTWPLGLDTEVASESDEESVSSLAALGIVLVFCIHISKRLTSQ